MNRRPRLAAGALLLLTFIVGGLAGMALEEAAGLDWFDFLDEDNQPTAGQILAGLDLTPDQRSRIGEILEEQDERLEVYWRGRIPEMRTIVATSFEEIREVLSPAQRETFDERIRAQGVPLPQGPD